MSKSVSHYLRDYLKLTDSAKFNLIGGFGVERKLTPAEEGNMNTTVLKFLKLKVPAPGPNDVFKYEIKSAADFTAAPVAGYANYGEFIQDFKDVQKAIVKKFLDDADAAAAPAAAAPAGAAAAAPFMGGRRSKQYGGNPAVIAPLKDGAAVAGVVAAGDPISAIGFISNPFFDKLIDLLRGNFPNIYEEDLNMDMAGVFFPEANKLVPYMVAKFPDMAERKAQLDQIALFIQNPDPKPQPGGGSPIPVTANGLANANQIALYIQSSYE